MSRHDKVNIIVLDKIFASLKMCTDNTDRCRRLEDVLRILRGLIELKIDIDPNPKPSFSGFSGDMLTGISRRFPNPLEQANQKQQQIEELSNLIQQLIVLDENGQIDYLLINEMQLKFYNIHQLLQQIYDAKLEINPHQSKQLNIYLYEMLSRILC